MVTARGLLERNARKFDMIHFDEDESPRSLQLYGTDPAVMREAVTRLVEGDLVDHLDLNLGCPVRKVTRHGGGAAITAHPRLVAALVGAAVDAAGSVPVTVKFRVGIDDGLLTYLDTAAGRMPAPQPWPCTPAPPLAVRMPPTGLHRPAQGGRAHHPRTGQRRSGRPPTHWR
jgi:tRNA-dihydrouridine synthase